VNPLIPISLSIAILSGEEGGEDRAARTERRTLVVRRGGEEGRGGKGGEKGAANLGDEEMARRGCEERVAESERQTLVARRDVQEGRRTEQRTMTARICGEEWRREVAQRASVHPEV
jgi:hypothetical protein